MNVACSVRKSALFPHSAPLEETSTVLQALCASGASVTAGELALAASLGHGLVQSLLARGRNGLETVC